MTRRLFGSQLRTNMVSGAVATVLNALVVLFAYRMYLHLLGYKKYGVWPVSATVLNGAYLGNLGLSAAVTKYVAEGIGRSDGAFVEAHIIKGFVVVLVVGTVFLLVVTLLRGHIVGLFKLTGENRGIALTSCSPLSKGGSGQQRAPKLRASPRWRR
ncbi:MAG: hypothetical protein JSW27_24300 [Phycisphaerales bacterium]|nr:MAG: hypothetical protein JSW27_24300 [Phycisphaerales bacterium]